jgi:hypothetical protein
MQLSKNQIAKIKQKVNLNNERLIVRINVSEDKAMPPDESSSNIYCINNEYKIIWQVKEIKTKRPFDDDMFVYLGKNDKDEIVAGRFSGFTYKIDPETGEAEQTGFRK